jgi:hypothetical protein
MMYDVASFETTCQLHVGRGNTKHKHRATRPTTLTRRLSGDNLHQRPLQPYISQICCWGFKVHIFQYVYALSMALGRVFPSFVQFHHQTLSPSFKPSTVKKPVLARSSNGQEPSSTGSVALQEKKTFPGIL